MSGEEATESGVLFALRPPVPLMSARKGTFLLKQKRAELTLRAASPFTGINLKGRHVSRIFIQFCITVLTREDLKKELDYSRL